MDLDDEELEKTKQTNDSVFYILFSFNENGTIMNAKLFDLDEYVHKDYIRYKRNRIIKSSNIDWHTVQVLEEILNYKKGEE